MIPETNTKYMTNKAIEHDSDGHLPFLGVYYPKGKDKTAYLHKPPTISPNLGKPVRNPLPKTFIARVLLYENTVQQNLLEAEVNDINTKTRQRKAELYKKKFLFVDQQKKRQHTHEMWDNGYRMLKDAYIKRYGTEYMPVPTPEPDVDPFFIHARIMPILNILTFYLDTLWPKDEVKPKLSYRRHSYCPDTSVEYLFDHDRLIKTDRKALQMYSHSVDDPRFRKLENALIPPYFKNDGYLQLSPGYHPPMDVKKRLKKWVTLKHRAISLPRFYRIRRVQIVSRESVRSASKQRHSMKERGNTMPLITQKQTRFLLPTL